MRVILTAAASVAAAFVVAGPMLAATASGAEYPKPAHPLSAALTAAESGNKRTAATFAARSKDPLVKKLITWRLLSLNGTEGPFDTAARFLDENPDWPRKAALRAAAERDLPQAWSAEQIIGWLERHPPVTLEGRLRRVQTLYQKGLNEQAATAAREIWVKDDIPFVQQKPFLQRFGRFLRPEDERARFDRLLRARSWTAATRQAIRLGGSYPALTRTLGQLSRGRIDLETAVKRLPPEQQSNPALRYEAARHLRRQKRTWAVFAILDFLPPDAAEAERWWPLRHWTARRLLEEEAPDKAYKILQAHGQKEGAGFAEAEWLAGWVAYRHLNRPSVALGHFRRMSDAVSTPVSAARGAYWSGRAAEAVGRKPEAEIFYRAAARHGTAFYGQLAAKQLGQKPLLGQLGPRPTPAQIAAFHTRELVRATRRLAWAGELNLVRVFLTRLERQAEGVEGRLLVADLAREVGRPDQALQIARRLRNEGVVVTDRLFPRGWGLPKIRHRLDPDLVHAVIRQESGFYTKAVSHAGARGLMQLMPATARQTARREGLAFARSKLTSQPGYNMRLGTAYLTDMLERFDGSLPLALAAYNGGPHNVSTWIERFGEPGPSEAETIDWIESIPFSETRNYVQRIIETIAVYRLLDGADGHADLLSPGYKSIN